MDKFEEIFRYDPIQPLLSSDNELIIYFVENEFIDKSNNLDIANIPEYRKKEIVSYLDSNWTNKGFRRESDKESKLWNNFDALMSLKILEADLSKYAAALVKLLASFQTIDGGFKTSQRAYSDSISATYAAVIILSLINKYNIEQVDIELALGLPK